ncbi:MAG: hypothetical protein GX674_10965, partial [Clostridiales bacterium]|nr:hypothetical protein [Clostridiales bacterium]
MKAKDHRRKWAATMQQFVLGRKNHITAASAVLIIIAYVSKLGFHDESAAVW